MESRSSRTAASPSDGGAARRALSSAVRASAAAKRPTGWFRRPEGAVSPLFLSCPRRAAGTHAGRGSRTVGGSRLTNLTAGVRVAKVAERLVGRSCQSASAPRPAAAGRRDRSDRLVAPVASVAKTLDRRRVSTSSRGSVTQSPEPTDRRKSSVLSILSRGLEPVRDPGHEPQDAVRVPWHFVVRRSSSRELRGEDSSQGSARMVRCLR